MSKAVYPPLGAEDLADTLVLAVRKSFWAQPECEIFPHRIYARRLMGGNGPWGSMTRNPLNNLTAVVEGLLHARRHRTRLVIIASAARATQWFIRFKRAGWLPDAKLLAITHSYFSDQAARWLEKIVVYSRSEIALHDPAIRSKYVFIPLPADGDFAHVQPPSDADTYIFSGGGAGRDFGSLIQAMDGLPIPLRLITFSPESLGYSGPIPANCQILYKMPLPAFLSHMAGARFVVAPLHRGDNPHGHTTIIQALCLGKAVISTQEASADDYVQHGQNGLLIPPGDVAGYRAAILQLWQDEATRQRLATQALRDAAQFSYAGFAQRFAQVCVEVLASA